MNELIEKIVERLEKESKFFEGKPMGTLQKTFYCKGVESAISIVKELAEEYAKDTNVPTNDGWIPVEDGLPPRPKENPLFDNKILELYLVSVCSDYPFRAFWNGKYFTDGWSKVEPKAWQPLPEPYQPKGE